MEFSGFLSLATTHKTLSCGRAVVQFHSMYLTVRNESRNML